MGKTVGGAVWLDPDKTSPFDFFQYWRNVGDDDVIKCLKMLTFLPLEEIRAMEAWEGAELNRAKEILAHELTSLVHSKAEADKALETARALFSAGAGNDMPTAELTKDDLTDSTIDILSILQKSGLCPSKSEARRAVEQGGIEASGEKVTEFSKTFSAAELSGDGIVVKRGKKNFKRIVIK